MIVGLQVNRARRGRRARVRRASRRSSTCRCSPRWRRRGRCRRTTRWPRARSAACPASGRCSTTPTCWCSSASTRSRSSRPDLALQDSRSSLLDEVPYTEGPYRPAIEVVAEPGGQPAGADGVGDAARRLEPRRHRGVQAAARRGAAPHGRRPDARRGDPHRARAPAGRRHPHGRRGPAQGADIRPLGDATRRGASSAPAASAPWPCRCLPRSAAKLVEPQTPVVCLTGDGGFLMRVGDLETAVREDAAHRRRRVQRPRAQPDQAAAGPSRLPAPRHQLRARATSRRWRAASASRPRASTARQRWTRRCSRRWRPAGPG